jgi:hypothetical protein
MFGGDKPYDLADQFFREMFAEAGEVISTDLYGGTI